MVLDRRNCRFRSAYPRNLLLLRSTTVAAPSWNILWRAFSRCSFEKKRWIAENLREAEKKEIPSGISVLWYLEHFFSLQSNFHSWSIFFSSTNRKTLRNRGAIVLALTFGHFVPSYDSCNCIALRKPPTWTNPPRDKYLPISRPWEWTITSLRLWICDLPIFPSSILLSIRAIDRLQNCDPTLFFAPFEKSVIIFHFFSRGRIIDREKERKKKNFRSRAMRRAIED